MRITSKINLLEPDFNIFLNRILNMLQNKLKKKYYLYRKNIKFGRWRSSCFKMGEILKYEENERRKNY